MSYIVITRNPSSGQLIALHEDEDGTIAEFEKEYDAQQAAIALPVFEAWGYEVLEIDYP